MDGVNGHEAAHIRLGAGLFCGLDGCGRPAVCGTAEPDPDYTGLWLLLPLCEDCHTRLSDADAATVRDMIHLADR